MSREYKLSEMVDLALATPKIGVVNCFMLHALLHALIKRLNIGECMASVVVQGDENIPFTEMPARTIESKAQTEGYDGGAIVVVSPDQVRSRTPLPREGSNAGVEKKMSRQRSPKPDRSDGPTASHGRDGVNDKGPQSSQRESSTPKKDVPSRDSKKSKRKRSIPDGSKSQRPDGPSESFEGDDADAEDSHGLQGESSATKKDKDSESSKKTTSGPVRSKSERSGEPTGSSGQAGPQSSKAERTVGPTGSSSQDRSKSSKPQRVDGPTGLSSQASPDGSTGLSSQSAPDGSTGLSSQAAPDGSTGLSSQAAPDGSTGLFSQAAPDSSTGLSSQAAPDGSTGWSSQAAPDGSTGLSSQAAPDGSTGLSSQAAPDGSTGLFSQAGPGGSTGLSSQAGPGGSTGLSSQAAPGGSTVLSSQTGPGGSTGLSGQAGPGGSTGLSGQAGPGGSTGLTSQAGPGGPTGLSSQAGPGGSTGLSSQAGHDSSSGRHDLGQPTFKYKAADGSPTEDDVKMLLDDFLHRSVQSSAGSPESSSPTGQQYGIPFIENGVQLLVFHLKDVPDLVKDLKHKVIENENQMNAINHDNEGKMEILTDIMSKLMETMGSVSPTEKEKPRKSPFIAKQGSYEDLKRKMDKMVQMSNDLENQVFDKLTPEGIAEESKSHAKKKPKKEPRGQKPSKKVKETVREKKSSGSEIDSSEGSDKDKRSKGGKKGLGQKTAERDATAHETTRRDPATGEEKSKRGKPVRRDAAGQDAAGSSAAAQDTAEGEASCLETESASEGASGSEKPPPPEAHAPKGEEGGIVPKKKRPLLFRSKTNLQPDAQQEGIDDSKEGIETLQNKVNVVLRLMNKMEKAMHHIPDFGKTLSGIGKEDDGVSVLKAEGSRDDQAEAPKHKETQAHYQLLNNRLKKVEEDQQKLFTLMSSDSSSSSNLTKMVGDFLNTLSKTSSSDQAVSESKPKKTRKERAKKEDGKGEEEGREGGEVSLEKGETIGEEGEAGEGESEKAEKEEEEEETDEKDSKRDTSDEEGKTKDMETIHDIPILKDFEPEKLSDLWDQLKILAEAFRGMKCNVISLEKNSKNMAKALHTMMKGNMNIVDEDFEIIGEMKMVVRKILVDIKSLDVMVNTDKETLDGLKETLENLLQDFEETKTLWAEKMENLRLDMMTKADRHDLDNMVSSVQKKLNIADYRREVDKLKADTQEQVDNFMMDIQTLKNDKYDRFEMDIFRIWVECKLNATKKIPQADMNLDVSEDDGAILKKKIPYHCLSCDKSLMITPQTRIPNKNLVVVPLSKRTRPMSANEVDPSRLLRKREKVLLEGKDNKLYQGHKKPIMNNENNAKSPQEVKQKPDSDEQNLDALPNLERKITRRITGIPEELIKDKSNISVRNIVVNPESAPDKTSGNSSKE